MRNATVTVPLEDIDAMRRELTQNEATINDLTRKIEEARMQDPEDRIADLCAMIRTAIPVVSFAVGNLEPSTVRGWPHAALTLFADGLNRLPVPDQDASVRYGIRELAADMKEFAHTAARFEEERSRRVEPLTVATAADFGPKTDSARAVHEARAGNTSNVVIHEGDDPI